MATTKRSTSPTKSSASKRSPSSSSKRSTSTAAKSTKGSTSTRSASAAHRKSASTTAHKTGSKTAHGQAWTDQHSDNPSSTGHGKAKKEPAKQTSQCWPGYEPVAGKARGTKGSCKPKAHQTAAQKKSDAMAAAASKLRKS